MPLDYCKYLLGRVSGDTCTHVYARRMDTQARRSAQSGCPVKPSYLDNGKLQLDYLIGEGLQPHHHVLDHGCGILRAGLYFTDYLESGRYTGVDISAERLQKGVVLADEHGLKRVIVLK